MRMERDVHHRKPKTGSRAVRQMKATISAMKRYKFEVYRVPTAVSFTRMLLDLQRREFV